MNKLDRISIHGKQLKVVYYNEPLWRADYQHIRNGANARMDYSGALYKYFTTSPDELESYTRKGMTYVKRWIPTRPLVLIDIMDKSTHSAIKQLIGEEYLKTPFPVNNEGNPYRVSEPSTTNQDYAFLDQLCKLSKNGEFDGYYMKRQEKRKNEKVATFHSEIGLCSSAFDNLILQNPNKKEKIAPALPQKTRKRINYNTHNTVNTIMNIPKMSNIYTGSLKRPRSNNSNNTNIAIMNPPKRRKINTMKNNTMKNNTMKNNTKKNNTTIRQPSF